MAHQGNLVLPLSLLGSECLSVLDGLLETVDFTSHEYDFFVKFIGSELLLLVLGDESLVFYDDEGESFFKGESGFFLLVLLESHSLEF